MRYLFVILLFIFIQTKATIYYVADTSVTATASDANAGTDINNPWFTWQKAFTTADKGDTVYFRGGTWCPDDYQYSDAQVYVDPPPHGSMGHNGNEDTTICFFNYPGETPILDCINVDTTGHQYNDGITLYWVNFWHIKGLTIRNVMQPRSGLIPCGISAWTCSNIKYENIIIHDVGGRGFYHLSAFGVPYEEEGPIPTDYDTTWWINCDAYNLLDSLSELGFSEYGNAADGWKVQNYAGHFAIDSCRAWNCSDDGFDMSGNQTAHFNNCWAFANGYEGAMDGNGFKIGGLWDTAARPSRIVTRCVATYNTGSGFYNLEYYPGDRSNARFYNNVSYKDAIGLTINENDSFPNSESIFRNMIIYEAQNTDAAGREAKIDAQCFYYESHNNFDYDDWEEGLPQWIPTDTVTVTDADFTSLDTSALNNARNANYSLPSTNFMRLANTSDLIDAGIDIPASDSVNTAITYTLEYNSSAPDLGWYEYGTPESPELPTVINSTTTRIWLWGATLAGNCNDDGGGTVSDKGVCWGTSENPTTSDNCYSAGSGTGAISWEVKRLDKGTTYHVRNYATNEEGTAYSDDYTFTTLNWSIVINNDIPILHNGQLIYIE